MCCTNNSLKEKIVKNTKGLLKIAKIRGFSTLGIPDIDEWS